MEECLCRRWVSFCKNLFFIGNHHDLSPSHTNFPSDLITSLVRYFDLSVFLTRDFSSKMSPSKEASGRGGNRRDIPEGVVPGSYSILTVQGSHLRAADHRGSRPHSGLYSLGSTKTLRVERDAGRSVRSQGPHERGREEEKDPKFSRLKGGAEEDVTGSFEWLSLEALRPNLAVAELLRVM